MKNINYLTTYINHLKDVKKSPGTIKQYHSDLKSFILWLNKTFSIDIKHLTRKQMNSYINYLYKQKYSTHTIKRHLSSLRQFLQYYNMDVAFDTSKEHKISPLDTNDFISKQELTALLKRMCTPSDSEARNILMSRNIAIVHIIRYNGLRPKDISEINMDKVSLSQSTLEVKGINYKLKSITTKHIRDYLKAIDSLKRPRYHSKDALFVAYNNLSNSFQYDYEKEQPKRLSVRGIQEMIKDEVQLAGLRKLSAKHMRNSCILDTLREGNSEQDILDKFHLTNSLTIRRYHVYLKSKTNLSGNFN